MIISDCSESDTFLKNYTTNTGSVDVDYGYYLVAETQVGDTTDTYSLVLLNTAGSTAVTFTTKEDTPTLEKKVQDTNDSTNTTSDWQDSADADIGDHVSFKLTGTVSSYYADYETYYYAFHDKMEDGLTFDNNSVVVTIDGTTVAESCYTVSTTCNDGCDFEVIFEDLKKNITDTSGDAITVTKDSKIVVTFTAELNEDAVLGKTGNLNEAKLEYNNNPYYDGTGSKETGETPWDQVVVLTYQLDVNKVIASTTTALGGATFKLEKYYASTNTWVTVAQDTSSTDSTFVYKGLDDGDYRITEVDAPAGYNKLTAPIYFTVNADHTITFDTWSTEGELDLTSTTSTTATHDAGTGAISTVTFTADASYVLGGNIENSSGSALPITGGMGTTLLYIIGAILVIGAGVLLVTRRRVSR